MAIERAGSEDPLVRYVEYVWMFAKVAQCSSRWCSMHSTTQPRSAKRWATLGAAFRGNPV
jgi:hypothetical protein